MRLEINKIILECVRGDIAGQPGFDAVVNAANRALLPGGGVAGAIHAAAGPRLAEECRKIAPIDPGEAVLTAGYNLPNKYVIHCLGPVYAKDIPSDVLLARCYRAALRLAEEKNLSTIAFCAISTGIFGYPLAEAARVAFAAIYAALPLMRSVRHIRFVLHSEEALAAHKQALKELLL